MKVRILREDLSRGLAMVGRLVSTRAQLPVLGNVLILADKTGVVLATTNLEMGMRVQIGGKVLEEGAITVPAKIFGEFIGSVGGESVEMETEGGKLVVKAGKFGASWAGIGAEEFPPFAELAEKEAVKISRAIIDQVARQVTYAAAVDESRPVLTGVQVATTGEELVFTATDGFRMSKKKIQDSKFKIQNPLIIPARAIFELARIAGGSGEGVAMQIVKENNQVIFGCGEVELVSRVLEGNFPDVVKIIPTEFATEILTDREELIGAVRAIGVFARENNNIVRFKVQDSGFNVFAAGGQIGESRAEVEAEVEGEDVEIAFNYKFVMDFLNSVDGERVELKVSGNAAPGVWGVEGKDDLVHLIMPVRV